MFAERVASIFLAVKKFAVNSASFLRFVGGENFSPMDSHRAEIHIPFFFPRSKDPSSTDESSKDD